MARPRSTAKQITTPGTLVSLPVSLLDEDPGQPRQDFDAASLAKLTETVRSEGITVPLEVIPTPDGRYRLVMGARRTRAAIAAGVESVPCVISTAKAPLDVRRRQLLENMQRADLAPLEQAQSLYTIWLLHQIGALEQEQGDDGATTSRLVAEHPLPTAQMAIVEQRLCALAAVESVAAYAGSGAGVRVPWAKVLQSVGMDHLSESARKKMLRVLKLPSAVQDALAGTNVSTSTLRELAQHPEEEALALVEQATRADGDTGAALRSALDASSDAETSERERDGTGEGAQLDLASLLAPMPGDRSEGGEYGDPLPLLTDSHGSASRLVTDQPAPKRGSAPPSSAAFWSQDDALTLQSGLEACVGVAERIVGPRFTSEQQRAIGVVWRELVERLEAAGIAEEAFA